MKSCPFPAELCVLPTERDQELESRERWTDAKNARRFHLIDKKHDEGLTPQEERELDDLRGQLSRYRQRVAPLPIAELEEVLERLRAQEQARHSPPTESVSVEAPEGEDLES